MKVTAIEPLDKRRSKVLFDEGFAFALYKGEIRKYRIVEGGELSAADYQEIVSQVLSKRARERMAYLLKSTDKTEQEIRKKLKDAWYPDEAIEAAISFGVRHHYIDDERYVERYIEYKGRRKSKKQITFELRQKGIAAELVSRLMEENPIDEEEQVRTYLRKKRIDCASLTREERYKAASALARKGISWETIRRVMGEG